jgi:hypothetical protein
MHVMDVCRPWLFTIFCSLRKQTSFSTHLPFFLLRTSKLIDIRIFFSFSFWIWKKVFSYLLLLFFRYYFDMIKYEWKLAKSMSSFIYMYIYIYIYVTRKKNIETEKKETDVTFCWFNPGKKNLLERKRTIESW